MEKFPKADKDEYLMDERSVEFKKEMDKEFGQFIPKSRNNIPRRTFMEAMEEGENEDLDMYVKWIRDDLLAREFKPDEIRTKEDMEKIIEEAEDLIKSLVVIDAYERSRKMLREKGKDGYLILQESSYGGVLDLMGRIDDINLDIHQLYGGKSEQPLYHGDYAGREVYYGKFFDNSSKVEGEFQKEAPSKDPRNLDAKSSEAAEAIFRKYAPATSIEQDLTRERAKLRAHLENEFDKLIEEPKRKIVEAVEIDRKKLAEEARTARLAPEKLILDKIL